MAFYQAYDTVLQIGRVVKEYFPEGSVREGGLTMTPPPSQAALHQTLTEKFLDEARLIAAVNHAGVIKMIDFFYANNTAYYVTEYLGGQSLGQLLAASQTPFTVAEISGWLEEITSALEAVHGKGLLHQDIKPDNIIITESGKAVLIDFGAARAYAAGKTQRYSITYTPGYAPPEQQVEQAKRGPYTDIYALGATLYELLTKTLPADAPLRHIQPNAFVRPGKLTGQLSGKADEAIVWALEILPEKRPQSVKVFMEKWCGGNAKPPVMAPNATAPAGMVYVEGGSFTMGDTFNDGDGFDDEKPTHQVTVRSFYIGKYAVTFDEYDAFCQATRQSEPRDRGWGRGNRPVINVSWYDAAAYCNWRSEQEGLKKCYSGSGDSTSCDYTANGYRLPTEAEWEYAARGGKKGKGYKYSGGNAPGAVAWYDGNSREMAHPVGKKQPNELGLYDMSGNVWEWCWDWYNNNYYRNSPSDNPVGPSVGANRVDRGGSWNFDARYLRVSYRNDSSPGDSFSDLGFRPLRTL